MKSNIKVGDKVVLLRDELLDDHYQDSLKTVVKQGTVMEVVAITPKVRMTKGLGNDSCPYFLNLIQINSHCKERVRTHYCNVRLA